MAQRVKNGVVAAIIEDVPGTFQSSLSAAVDGFKVEDPKFVFPPQNTETNNTGPSLDGDGPIPGGIKPAVSFKIHLRGSGVAGVPAEWGKLLRAAGFSETVLKTDIAASTISVTDANTIADSGNGLAALTVGTHLSSLGFLTAANNQELRVTSAAAGSIDVAKPDGSAANLVAEAAGAAVTLRRGIAGTAATAGTATGFTAQAPFAGTANLYRFLPVLLSGNPAAAVYASILDYTAGRVATLADLFGSALDASTIASIPALVAYVPATASLPKLSFAWWDDGVRYRLKGAVVSSCKFTWTTAQTATLEMTLSGKYHDIADEAVPTAVAYDGTRPGVFRNSPMLVNRLAVALQMVSIDCGLEVTWPENPNETEGFDSPEIVARRLKGSMNPLRTLIATEDYLSRMRSGTPLSAALRMMGGQAANVGQRLGIVVPDGVIEKADPGERGKLRTKEVDFFPRGYDSGFGLTIW